MKSFKKYCQIVVLTFFAATALAHEGHHHHVVRSQAEKVAGLPPDVLLVYSDVNQKYKAQVEPIFEQKCAACHSALVQAPWYASIPGLHQLIEDDRSEAKEHLEISKGFPFAGHGAIDEDLDSIRKMTEKNKMPTRFYKWMHPSSRLTVAEKEMILNWVSESEKQIAAVSKHDVKHDDQHDDHHDHGDDHDDDGDED